jgi:hypothetical protein
MDLHGWLIGSARDSKRLCDGQVATMFPTLVVEHQGGVVCVALHGTVTEPEVALVARALASHWLVRAVSFTCDSLLSDDLAVDLVQDFTTNPASEVRRAVVIVRVERGGYVESCVMCYRYDDAARACWDDPEPEWQPRHVVGIGGVFTAMQAVFAPPVDGWSETQAASWIIQRGHAMMVAS